MSTQRFEYNGFPVSEGTVAAFPCGTVTAGAEPLRASRFPQACDGRGHRPRRPMDWRYANDGRGCRRETERSGAPRDSFGPASDFRLRRVPPRSGGTHRRHCPCPPRSAAVGAPDHRLARFTWNSDDLGQPFPHAAAWPRFEGDFGPDFSLSVRFVGQPRTRWCAIVVRSLVRDELGRRFGRWRGHRRGACLDGLDCDHGFSSLGRERSAWPLSRRRTAWRSGSSPPARSRRWQPSSRRRSTGRWTSGAWTKRRTSGADGGSRTRLWARRIEQAAWTEQSAGVGGPPEPDAPLSRRRFSTGIFCASSGPAVR